MSRDIYEMHKVLDPTNLMKKVCTSNKCDVFFDGKYEHSYGPGMLGKRTRNIPKEELNNIATEIKRFKEAMKKRKVKGEDKKVNKKNPVLVA